MKLLKFVSADAPDVSATSLELSLRKQRVSVSARRVGEGSDAGSVAGRSHGEQSVAKTWRLTSCGQTLDGCYWLLDDNNEPVGPIREVLLATRDDNDDASGPKGITDDHVKGIDFRNKVGRRIQKSREDYGNTYKTSARYATAMVDAGKQTSKREERLMQERKRVAEAIENGEDPSLKVSKKEREKGRDSERERGAVRESKREGGDSYTSRSDRKSER
ncbi:hypothetical protein ERJ75_001341600 [Trypanosoma vivax]|uniref:Uncharacterized protein n=1 Tax=Trypanosoma vivax (strain Y486) TaxID=1055687 RepID=G0U5Z8_TRYVY|nr:hypothetical protein TRVL_06509 [Trypanosoma vivax]KAH8607861.1 hypothetical protein ERJ75_001341600 [Trypanosoma vivax]CCC51299.1 conserved hypothetical protein [Trypanosoma vivax Y486]